MARLLSLIMERLIFILLLQFFLCSSIAFADDNGGFYEDDVLTIPWNNSIQKIQCSQDVQAKTGPHCVQIGSDGNFGLVMLTINDNIDLYSPQKLSQHLSDSENALHTVKDVHVMQTRMLKPQIGMIEILRKDSFFPQIPALSKPPVRQTSLIIPTCHNKLYQIFIYLPTDSSFVNNGFEQLIDSLSSATLKTCPVWAQDQPKSLQTDQPKGVLDLMPRVLFYGIAFAALCILLLIWRKRLSDRAKDKENKLQDEIINSQ